MKTTDSRKAFLDFCDTMSKMEGDKDKFLAAARLQPTFTAVQLIGVAILIGMLLLGSVAIICLTLAGKTGFILPALGGTLAAVLLIGIIVMGGF